MAKRLQAMGQPNYANGFKITCHMHMLDVPLKRRKPTMYFVCSMSDLFHEDVPFSFIQRVFDTVRFTPQHTYQVLTKRPHRMLEYATKIGIPINVWVGTSVEGQHVVDRIRYLAQIPMPVRFVSCEPLLQGLYNLPLHDIDWVIVGGESGPGARPIDLDWARGIRDQCIKSETPFFFKQIGGVNKKATGRMLDGRTWDEMPKAYQAETAATINPSEKLTKAAVDRMMRNDPKCKRCKVQHDGLRDGLCPGCYEESNDYAHKTN
jgi:protein gp37